MELINLVIDQLPDCLEVIVDLCESGVIVDVHLHLVTLFGFYGLQLAEHLDQHQFGILHGLGCLYVPHLM